MDGVVFDFDGVIAQSMEQHAEAYRRILGPLGVEVHNADVFAREGARSESIIRGFLEDAGQNPSAAEVARLANEKQAVFRALGTPPLYRGAEAMVRAVQEAILTGLVTGTRLQNLEHLIPNLLPGFGAVMSQETYTHDKPHPEPYQKAAEAMNVDPNSLVAVENAVRGIQSARAAGYGLVYGIATTMEAEALQAAGADQVFLDHSQLATALLQLAALNK